MNIVRTLSRVAAIAAILFLSATSGRGQDAPSTTVLTNCNVIDCTGADLQTDMTVVIVGDTISQISDGAYSGPTGDNVRVVDLDGAYVLPGLWNMHTHLSALLPDPANVLVNETTPSAVIRSGLNAMDGLRHGFTALVSVGERDYLDVAWRDAFDAGFFIGPRIFASGESIATTAGHRGGVEHGADGVAEIRKAIRQRIQKGANLIKIIDVEMLDDELQAAIDTTHSLGRHITAHSREPATYRSVQAGIDCIEHG